MLLCADRFSKVHLLPESFKQTKAYELNKDVTWVELFDSAGQMMAYIEADLQAYGFDSEENDEVGDDLPNAESQKNGEWSKEMTKSDMKAKLRIDSYYKLNKFAKRHGIRKVGTNRQSFEIRLNKMNSKDREKLTNP